MDNHNDPYGLGTLERIAQANRLNEWMFDSIRDYCKGSVLEIGSGIGNISDYFIRNNYTITLSDFQQSYCEELKRKYTSVPNVKGILSIDLVHPDFDKEYAHLLGTFDSLFTLNVIEHIEDDVQAVGNCRKLLKSGGSFVMLVPSYQWLFNDFDVQLGHFRRYNKTRVAALLKKNNFDVKRCWHFNFAGVFGWYLSGSILRKKELPEGQLRLFNFLTPVFRLADALIMRSAGLSVIAAGVKS